MLERWLLADHPWKPSTLVGYRSNARFLTHDAVLARSRVVSLTPVQLRATSARWSAEGASTAVIGGRFRVLRAATGWAYDERIIDGERNAPATGAPGHVLSISTAMKRYEEDVAAPYGSLPQSRSEAGIRR